MNRHRLLASEHLERQKLYDAGKSDREIAEAVGVGRRTIANWRQGQDLPCKSSRAAQAKPGDIIRQSSKIKAMVQQGLDDRQIAKRIACNRNTILDFRQTYGIAAVGIGGRKPGYSTDGRINPVMFNELYRTVSAAVDRGIATDVAEEAIGDVLVDVLSGAVSRSDLRVAAKLRRKQAVSSWANRWGARSLDEDRNGEGWTLYAQLPDRAAESDFRVIELSALASRMGLDPAAIIASEPLGEERA